MNALAETAALPATLLQARWDSGVIDYVLIAGEIAPPTADDFDRPCVVNAGTVTSLDELALIAEAESVPVAIWFQHAIPLHALRACAARGWEIYV